MQGEKRGSEEGAPEDDLLPELFDKLPNDPKMLVLEHLWRDYEIEIVLAICEAYPVFSANYPNPNRGGVIGELLQRSNPRLRKMQFPFLAYEILTNLDKPWDFNTLSSNTSITPELFVATQQSVWNPIKLSENTAITTEMVERFPDLEWDWRILIENSSVPPEFVLVNRDKVDEISFWHTFSLNPSVMPDFVETHPELPWNARKLSMNPSVTEEFVASHPDMDWSYRCLSWQPNITLEFAMENPNHNWFRIFFSGNPSTTPETIEKHPRFLWDWQMLSTNPSMTPEFVEKHADKGWNWMKISRNPHLTGEFVWKFREKNLSWDYLRYNKTVMDYLKRNRWEEISSKFPPIEVSDEYRNKSMYQHDMPL